MPVIHLFELVVLGIETTKDSTRHHIIYHGT